MHSANVPQSLRRSSRVPTALPILVTSLDGTQFSEVCETLVVNAHGCLMMSPVKLDSGVPLRLHSKEGREATAHVVYCQPIGSEDHGWRLGAKLDRPENFWGLQNCPKDWALPTVMVQTRPPQTFPPTILPAHHMSGPIPSEAMIDRAARQLEERVKRMIAESMGPLQAEVTAVREQLAERQARPPRFEVSLSSIPPELEQQLEARLKRNLEPKALEEARQQYTNLLAAAKATIDQKTREGYEDFLQRVGHELEVVEKRGHDISEHLSETTREHLRRGLDDFRQKLMEGGNSLKRLSDELLQFVQDSVSAEHSARLAELEQLRSVVASESARLHEHIEYLDVRIRNLDESVRSMESGLDKRLSKMSSNTVKDARGQMESAGNDILEEWTARGAAAAANQVDEASGKMRTVQEEIVASGHESLRIQSTNALQDFEHSIDEVARQSVERWRLKLAGGLHGLAKSLGEQFQLEAGSDQETER
jgi:hypothetical protein